MNTFFIKLIFLIFTIFIFLYSASYVSFEITKNNNISGGVMVFAFTIISIVLSNVMFFIS